MKNWVDVGEIYERDRLNNKETFFRGRGSRKNHFESVIWVKVEHRKNIGSSLGRRTDGSWKSVAYVDGRF